MTLHVTAIDPSLLTLVRARGHDLHGNPVLVRTVTAPGAPLRCCLTEARVGERVALIAHRPAAVGGAYAEVGPVFVHAEACAGYEDDGGWPAGFAHRQQLLRAYDERGWQVVNRLAEAPEAPASAAELLDRPDVAVVHSRNLLAGCFMFAVTRG